MVKHARVVAFISILCGPLAGQAQTSGNDVSVESVDAPILDGPAASSRSLEEGVVNSPSKLKPAPESEFRMEELGQDARGKTTERRWRVMPFGRVRITLDDNIFISNTLRESDLVTAIAPGIAAGWGDYTSEVNLLTDTEQYLNATPDQDEPQSYIFGRYNPNAVLFAENSDINALEHDALVAGRWVGRRMLVGFRLGYQKLANATIDVGDRVNREITTARLNTQYSLSEKTSIELNLLGTINKFPSQLSWEEIVTESWLNYRLFPKTQVAMGMRLGTLEVDGSDRQFYEQLLTRVAYNASSKLAVSADGGLEWRQYGSAGDDRLFGVFSLGAQYAPFDGTNLSLRAFRRNSATVSLENETVTGTGVYARVTQRFLQRLRFLLEGGYETGNYTANPGGFSVGRVDNIYSVRSAVSLQVTRFLTAEASYQFQKNDSTIDILTFYGNNVSLQMSFQF